MNKKCIFFILTALGCIFFRQPAMAQGVHFSQYYNAPLLLNPANTALMPETDYRVGVHYRRQWAAIPVPYTTTSVYADFQALRNRNQTNWLGLGVALWNDKAGDGHLALTRLEGQVAYHVQLGYSAMISAGVAAAYVQRSVDFNKFTFDQQWNGFIFSRTNPTGEQGFSGKTNFSDLSAGVNLAIFPNENTYIKIGAGLAHLTQPRETLYGMTNQLGLRPTGNIDALLKLNASLIMNPSVYYTTQKSAMELVYGTLFIINAKPESRQSFQLLAGAYHRWNESMIGNIGGQYMGYRLIVGYDFTASSLTQTNKGRGAFELSLVYQGVYGEYSRTRRTYNCPRF